MRGRKRLSRRGTRGQSSNICASCRGDAQHRRHHGAAILLARLTCCLPILAGGCASPARRSSQMSGTGEQRENPAHRHRGRRAKQAQAPRARLRSGRERSNNGTRRTAGQKRCRSPEPAERWFRTFFRRGRYVMQQQSGGQYPPEPLRNGFLWAILKGSHKLKNSRWSAQTSPGARKPLCTSFGRAVGRRGLRLTRQRLVVGNNTSPVVMVIWKLHIPTGEWMAASS